MELVILIAIVGFMFYAVRRSHISANHKWKSGLSARSKGGQRAEYEDKLRNEVFDGKADVVTHEWTTWQPHSRADLVQLANEQGYKLVSSVDAKHEAAMYFEKR